MAITKLPQGHMDPKAVFLHSFQVQAAVNGTRVLAQWLIPFDAEILALHWVFTPNSSGTAGTENFDVQSDEATAGSFATILNANIDTDYTKATTYTDTFVPGRGTYDINPALKSVSAGRKVKAIVTTDADTTIDNCSMVLVLKPICGV